MIKTIVKFLERTGKNHPAQWEGKTNRGKEVYIRFRYNRLIAMVDGTVKVDKYLEKPEDSVTPHDILESLQDRIVFPSDVKREFLLDGR